MTASLRSGERRQRDAGGSPADGGHSFHTLFTGTIVGFLVSVALEVSVVPPSLRVDAATQGGIYERTTRGVRLYLATSQLCGLLVLKRKIWPRCVDQFSPGHAEPWMMIKSR
ncbi:hypothetical protein [Azospirillum sp. B506]|uniref:hypothetical protein n=1 Tax=Azospirillum sp. B506 TaxID=137721 RepID=UPI00244DBB58